LLITIDSRNLNGDVDVFTAVTFRPLMKTTIYASSQSPEVTKGIYLRAHQILILRVEARTPSDEPGTYQIRFGGTFERFSGGIPVAEASTAESEDTADKGGANRLSSVGATIPRPAAETTETAEAKPSPSPEIAAEKTPTETETAKKPESTSSRTGRPHAAEQAYREALALTETLLARDPNQPSIQYALAWCLATCPVPQLRDPAHGRRDCNQRHGCSLPGNHPGFRSAGQ
jgi:hypothetical protein